MRFWDSSALVPLVIGQKQTPEVESWLAEDPEVVVWTLSAVEVSSAIRRMARENDLSSEETGQSEELLAELMRRAHQIIDIETVKSVALRLLRVHPLRAADALQLGAAIVWAGVNPADSVFHTFDRRLLAAAAGEGFSR